MFGGFAWNRGTIFGLTLLPLGDVPRPLGSIEWTLVYEVFFYALVALVWTARSNRILGGFCLAWAVAITVVAVVSPSWGAGFTPTFPRIALSAYNYAFIGGVLAFYVPSPPRPRVRAHALRRSCPDSRSAANSSRRPSGGCCA